MKILLIDDETELLEIMEFMIHNSFHSSAEVYKASSGFEGIKILSEHSIDLCFCDHNMPNGMGNDVLKFIRDQKLATRFVLCSTVTPEEKPAEYPASALYGSIQKPKVAAGMALIFQKWEEESAPQAVSCDYIPVSIFMLELMGKTPADLYVKVSEDHFVKVMREGEAFTSDDKQKYSNRPIEILFLKNGEQQQSVDKALEGALQKIFAQRTIPLSDKLSIAHTQLVELIKFTGITPELAELSKKNIEQTVSVLSKEPLLYELLTNLLLIGEYPSRLYSLHTMLTSVVVKKMQWSSEATFFKLTLASFLQDISLDSIALIELCDYQEYLQNEQRFSGAEKKRYMEHPMRAVELIQNFREIPPDIDRILIEQHEMPNGEGFPKKLHALQISPLSCVFILTGIMARHLLKEGRTFHLNTFLSSCEAKGYSKGNFREVFECLKAMKQ